MIENNWFALLGLFLVGGLSSAFYLWLLWLSVKKLSGKPSILLSLSGFFIRLLMMGLAFFLIARSFEFLGVVFYLLGFLVMKKIIQAKKLYGYHH